MKLRGGQSLWPTLSPERLIRPPLNEHVQCDCLVVGSGITGALVAYHLAEAGASVVVVDRRNIATGSTPASTALLLYDLDTSLTDLRQRHGRKIADAVYRSSRRTLDDMISLVDRIPVQCSLSLRPSLLLAATEDDIPDLKCEAAARKELGLEAEYIDAEELDEKYHLSSYGAIQSRIAIEIDPWQLTNHLLKAAERLGCRIFSNTTLGHFPNSGTPFVCTANDCRKIEYHHVIWATGFETPEQFALVRKLSILTSTFVAATRPLSPEQLWPHRALLWNTADPYLYARTTADHRILIGGEDEPFADPESRDRLLPAKTLELMRKFSEIFPMGDIQLDTAWAGTFGHTEDGLPYIGCTAECPGCYFALGYGGNGITLSLLAAQIIRDRILGRENPNARLFAFDRGKTLADVQ
jgi:glycine/D-amino acid oxidase-like deaminating enzyme